ncbi:coiled-coil domain-containing protein 120 isoform X2 [Dunckerocampus dactyliophorus]|uniref:coiled-coil domain-containing protein 120 isoform X2 n=1 Tax=Dunckerocampus dactyliophorus TaxID=161453 RepID=UPI0024059234|nr:coiled-coil domain-containing protein 120 isoform X2 [Dunckerocampus dactyliophorus]
MEVKGELIPAPAVVTCWDRKQRERMVELQERRRSLQAMLSVRLAELRRMCLQEAELTGTLPADFPLATGEKPPCVRRRGGASRQTNRKCRVEEEDGQRVRPKKTLFSGALRKHNDREHNTQTQHGKTTVHRGCHTDDTVRSESSSTSESTGHDNDEFVAQSRPLLVAAGSPVELFYPSKPRRSSLCNRPEHPEVLQSHRPLLLQPPAPTRSHDSSPSSRPSEGAALGEVKEARRSNSSDGFLDRGASPEEEGAVPGLQGALRSRGTNAPPAANKSLEGGWRASGAERGRGYSDLLLDYVLTKQRQHSQPITLHQPPQYNGHGAQPPPGAPPTYHIHMGEQRRVKVTRTKSCGPFLPVSQADGHIQPDPHPHLLPPQPSQMGPTQDAHLEDATRSLHKALALEGLRDWYLRNTIGSSHSSQANGKVKGQAGGALQRRRTTHGVLPQPTYQTEAGPRPVPHCKQGALPHSVTFHGHPLHARSVDSSLYLDSALPHKQEVSSLREAPVEPTSPGTLV